jgi:homoserine O-acetyltransferase
MKFTVRSLLPMLCTAVSLTTGMGTMSAQSDQNPSASAPPSSVFAEYVNPAAKQSDVWFDNYRFRDGELLPRLRLHYATLGSPRLNAKGEIINAVLVLHWTGADGTMLQGPHYMKALFAPGRPLDAEKYYVIFPDNVGHGKSSKPSDGLKMKFPKYGYRDIVDLQHRLVTETLGIKHLHAILGMSMGGMNAWQWAEAYPNEMDGVMPVVALPIPISGRNLLWRRVLIDLITSDPEWDAGNYTKAPRGWVHAYANARWMIDGVPHLQATVVDVAAADAFIEEAEKEASARDANDLIYSLRSSMNDYNPEPGLTSIKTMVYALNFDDDEFNPAELHILEQLMPRVPHGQYAIQPGSSSSFGHLTMAHPELWADHVATFMKELEQTP